MILDFAGQICDTASIPLEGSRESVELTGKAKGELKSLLKKVADLGLGGDLKYQRKSWEGMIQEDLSKHLGNHLENYAKCKQEIFKDLKKELIPTNEQYENLNYSREASSSAGPKKAKSNVGPCISQAGPDGASANCD
ncbi:MAG: hypothetical protein D3917_02850 [Candidatus Electrothrix sp. AX5]|nr:hypothetical protein [Candidatus Electrothrix sp. AX5]